METEKDDGSAVLLRIVEREQRFFWNKPSGGAGGRASCFGVDGADEPRSAPEKAWRQSRG